MELENRYLMRNYWNVQMALIDKDEEIMKLREKNEWMGTGEKGIWSKLENEVTDLKMQQSKKKERGGGVPGTEN